MLPFSSGNSIGSGVFPEPNASGQKVDRAVASIWANPSSNADPRSQPHHGQSDPRQTWGNYSGQTHSNQAHIPEYHSWGYSQQHGGHLRESHSVWGSGEPDQAWKYSRPQANPAPQSAGVWQYPGSTPPEYHHEWNARNSSAGYYYVHHDQRAGDEYGSIPYDIGARRSYMGAPPTPGYPMPAHMQYYATANSGAAGMHASASPSPPTVIVPNELSGTPSPGPIGPAKGGPAGGAASFLFEAAAAAAVKETSSPKVISANPASGTEPASAPHGTSIMDAATMDKSAAVTNGEVSPSDRNRRKQLGTTSRKASSVASHPGNAPTGSNRQSNVTNAAVGSRQVVNNHHLRLHASGNEKAPLSSSPLQHGGAVTTLMIRNIPNRYTQSELMQEIKEAGFDNKFDFFYLPMDHETHANFGYAFINFIEERDVDPFTKRFNGLKLNRFTSNKIIQIVPAQLQGFQANLQHYCKKAVCTDDNLDYRPLFFVDGKCLEFHRASDFTDVGLSPRAADAVTSSIAQKQASRGQRGKGNHGSTRNNGGVFQRKSRE